MNIIEISYLLSAFIAFESAITVLRLNRRSPVNIIYAVFTLHYALMIVMYSLFLTAPTKEACTVWSRILMPLFVFIPALIVHFCLYLTRNKLLASSPWILPLLYLPPAIISERVSRGHIIIDFIMTPWGWDNVFDRDSVWTLFSVFYALCSILAQIILVVRWHFTTTSELEKKQSRVIMYSFLPGAFSILFCLLFMVAENPLYVTLVSDSMYAYFFTGFILGIRFTIKKYKLMSFNPTIPAAELLTGIREPVFLVTIQGVIIYQNGDAESLMGCSTLHGKKSVLEVFSCTDAIRKEIGNIAAGRAHWGVIDCALLNVNGNQKAYKLHLQGIKNELNELIGFLFIARADPAVRDFQKKFRITDRQVDIISLALSGLSNREIAGRLRLSERTVENHLFNIYNKIGIDNKIELLNTARRHHVIPN